MAEHEITVGLGYVSPDEVVVLSCVCGWESAHPDPVEWLDLYDAAETHLTNPTEPSHEH